MTPPSTRITTPTNLYGIPLPIQDRKDLALFVQRAFGVSIPNPPNVPSGFSTPWEAFCDSYFAKTPVTVWKASRGLGGKSFLAAVLGVTEALTYGCDVNILGGSGEQSKRVHGYMRQLWDYAGAAQAKTRVLGDPSGVTTHFVGGNTITALKASQASVRGPHPARLIIDEVDEVSMDIYSAAMGQPMDQIVNRDTPRQSVVTSHTVLSSTHQYADGTMTAILKLAADRGWGVHEWTYRETLEPEGWLSQSQVTKKRSEMTEEAWNTEVLLQEPNPSGRAIVTEQVNKMFQASLGTYAGAEREYIELEGPVGGGRYSHGADWARKVDKTVITTHRTDVRPIRLVAFEQLNRLPWPDMVQRFDERISRYHRPRENIKSVAYYDATGIGDVVGGYLTQDAMPVMMVGRDRSDMLSDYIKAVEGGELVSPMITYAYREHLYASVDDVYGSGHLPDTIASGALAWISSGQHRGWSRGSA